MEEKTIQAIPVMPLALMLGCIGAIIGLIIGVIYAGFFGWMFSAMLSNFNIPTASGAVQTIPSFFGVIFGIGALIIGPIMGFISGLIQGIIWAISYNFLAPRIGGIKIRIKEDYPKSTT